MQPGHTQDDVARIVHDAASLCVNVRILNWQQTSKNRYRFTLGLLHDTDPKRRYQQKVTIRYDGARRKAASVCWHGHRDFYRQLLTRLWRNGYEDSSVASTYYGDSEYPAYEDSRTEPAWDDPMVGPPVYPYMLSDTCRCIEGHGAAEDSDE
jgi:hypothetical protein